jgi:hypothetical protein
VLIYNKKYKYYEKNKGYNNPIAFDNENKKK